MVGSVHQQHGCAVLEERCELFFHGPQPSHQLLGILGQGGAVAVASYQVLGPHTRAVRCRPPKGRALDGRGDTAPHNSVSQAGLGQDLGHLGDVSEHVGQVADLHDPTEGSTSDDPLLQVPDDGLTGHQELVHQDVPRPDREPSGRGQGGQAWLVLGSDLQVVVDHGQLSVEQKVPIRAVRLHQVEQVVDEADQLHPVGLERVIPLAVPVGVRDDGDLAARPAR